MLTGFSTERTAEYIILYDIYEKIKNQYKLFYPFFYQKNRSDTNLSRKNEIGDLHLIICFARRPKTTYPGSNLSVITFRQSLFEHTNYFSTLKIPTIVGAPIGTSIHKIGFGSKCSWFQLYPTQDYTYTTCEFIDGIPQPFTNNFIKKLDDKNLENLLYDAPKFSWNIILDIIQEWNYMYKVTHTPALYNTIPGQKPVFIVYK